MANITYRKRTNGWEYRFDVGKVDGKRKQRSKGGFKTKGECIIAANEEFSKFNLSGVLINDVDISLADYLDYWLSTVSVAENKTNTVLIHHQIIENRLKPKLGMYKLKAVTTATVQDYIYELQAEGLSRSTVVGIIGTLSVAYDYAETVLKYVYKNPCDKIKYPKFAKKSDMGHYLISDNTVADILELLKDKLYFTVAIIIGLHCGLRIGEVYGLSWDDIDLENKMIHVRRQIVKRNFGVDVRKAFKKKGKKTVKSEWYTAELKSQAAYRDVYFDDIVLQWLLKYRDYQEKNATEYGEYYTFHYLQPETDEKGNTIHRCLPVSASIPCKLERINLMFVRENGEYISVDSFKYASRLIHEKITKEFDFHSLRHTHITRMVEAGMNPIVLKYRVGHENIETTLKYYTHKTKDLEKQGHDIIDMFYVDGIKLYAGNPYLITQNNS